MQYDFALTPLGGQIINAKGRFFKYRAGNGLIRVKLTDGGVIDLLPGQGVSNRNFESIEIVDKSGVTNNGTILAGDFDFRDERISGTVDVVDGGKARTIANQAYMGYSSITAAAGQFSTCQLWNPAGSGKRLIVEQITFTSDSAGGAVIVSSGNVACSVNGAGGLSKRLNYPRSVGELRKEARATRQADGFIAASPGATPVNLKPTEPFVIEPGNGLEVFYSLAGVVNVTASFEWFEEAL